MFSVTLERPDLYHQDYLAWLETAIAQLQTGQWDQLDREHLIEELRALGQSEKRRVRSLLEQIIRHLLLYQYWTTERANNANHWEAEIVSFRNQLNDDLSSNLKQHLLENLPKIYQNALEYVAAKTQLPNLPQTCPYSLNQLLNKAELPVRSSHQPMGFELDGV